MQDYFKYLSVQETRMKFRIDCFLVPTIRENYKADKKYKVEKWLCLLEKDASPTLVLIPRTGTKRSKTRDSVRKSIKR